MAYLVIARKYRPQSFDEIVGQEHVTQTLKSAIVQGKVAHAYLFSGPRGVGKTSAARILAKSLNCEAGISSAPCQKCANCAEITQGSSLDVLEIDGASNRGIDEVRALRENVKFAPARSRFKIYIIDEVHSLTHDAFNALLKTLEEPPSHVKFIFATTEAHRVLPTILSRCQRFDFRRIPLSLLVKKLSEIAQAEKIEIDNESLAEIALASGGGLRDAQTILDQLSAYSDRKIQKEIVCQALGVTGQQVLARFIHSIAERDTAALLGLVNQLEEQGTDLGQMVGNLIQHCRNLLICKVAIKNLEEIVDLSPEALQKIKEQADKLRKENVLLILHLLVQLQQEMKRSPFPKILLELTLVRMTEMADWTQIPDMVEQLKILEQREEPNFTPRLTFSSASAGQQPISSDSGPVTSSPAQVPEAPLSTPAQQTSLDQIRTQWGVLAHRIRSQKVPLGTALQMAKPVSLNGKRLTISFPNDQGFHKELAERPNNKKLLEQELQTLLGVSLGVEIILALADTVSSQSSASSKQETPHHLEHPMVKSAMEIFGGRVIHVQEQSKEMIPDEEKE